MQIQRHVVELLPNFSVSVPLYDGFRGAHLHSVIIIGSDDLDEVLREIIVNYIKIPPLVSRLMWMGALYTANPPNVPLPANMWRGWAGIKLDPMPPVFGSSIRLETTAIAAHLVEVFVGVETK